MSSFASLLDRVRAGEDPRRLVERIQVPPLMPMRDFTKLADEVEKMKEDLLFHLPEKVNDQVKQGLAAWTPDYAYEVEGMNIDNRRDVSEFFSRMKWALNVRDFGEAIDRPRQLLQTIETFKDDYRQSDMIRQTIAMMFGEYGRFSEFNERAKDIPNFPIIKYLKKLPPVIAKNSQYFDGTDELPKLHHAEYQIEEGIRLFSVFFKFREWVRRAESTYTRFLSKPDFLKAQRDDKLPAHAAVEILFHATTALGAVLRDGLKTRKQLGGAGGLGGGPDDMISLTADVAIAKSIVWASRLVTLVAKGQLKTAGLLKLASTFGLSPDEVMKGAKGLRMQDDTPEANLDLLRVLLGYGQFAGKLVDPVFVSVDLAKFKAIDPKQIGIVAVKVDMSKIPESRGSMGHSPYLYSMHEFRVPPEAIISIKKVPYTGRGF
jgi:hypothetical protein